MKKALFSDLFIPIIIIVTKPTNNDNKIYTRKPNMVSFKLLDINRLNKKSKNVTIRIRQITHEKNLETYGIPVILFNIISLINNETISTIINVIYAYSGPKPLLKKRKAIGKAIRTDDPIHRTVIFKFPVANISVTRGFDKTVNNANINENLTKMIA